MKNAETIVELKDVDYAYVEGDNILEDVSLTLDSDDFLGLIGPNGGGKTTLLKVILGLLKPDSGEVRVFGEKPKQGRDQVGYVPQYAKIDLDYPINAHQVVLMGLLGYKPQFSRYTAGEKAQAMEALRQVGMEQHAATQIGELSGGQRQRVLIARALVRKPKLLILDEPTSSVDPASEENFFNLLQEINTQSAIIIVSHDIAAIAGYINKVACMDRRISVHESGNIQKELENGNLACSIQFMGHGAAHGHHPGKGHHPEHAAGAVEKGKAGKRRKT